MKGVDGVVIAFFYLRKGRGEYEPLIDASGSQRAQVAAWATYTPPNENSRFREFRLFVPFSRFALPQGTSRVNATVYLRTAGGGGSGELVKTLASMSDDITLETHP